MSVMIYHNPKCSTSRNVLAIIRAAGEEPEIVEYLKDPPARERLAELITMMGISARELLRRKGTRFEELGLGDQSLPDEALLDAMTADPILVNRPIVVRDGKAVLARPAQKVLELFPDAGTAGIAGENVGRARGGM